MDELAAAAGVSRATVFNRFGSKLGVLQALFARCMESQEMEAIREALAIEDPVVALEAVIEAACAIWEAHGFVQEQLQAIVVLEPAASALVNQQRDEQRTDLQDPDTAPGSRGSAPPGARRGSGHRDAAHAHQPGVLPVAAARVRPLTAPDPRHDRRALRDRSCAPRRATG